MHSPTPLSITPSSTAGLEPPTQSSTLRTSLVVVARVPLSDTCCWCLCAVFCRACCCWCCLCLPHAGSLLQQSRSMIPPAPARAVFQWLRRTPARPAAVQNLCKRVQDHCQLSRMSNAAAPACKWQGKIWVCGLHLCPACRNTTATVGVLAHVSCLPPPPASCRGCLHLCLSCLPQHHHHRGGACICCSWNPKQQQQIPPGRNQCYGAEKVSNSGVMQRCPELPPALSYGSCVGRKRVKSA